MVMLIVCIGAPLVLGPLIAMATRHLFAIFIREAADLFLDREIHKAWAITLGTDVAIVNTAVFTLAWWLTVGLNQLKLSPFATVTPFLLAVLLCYVLTRGMVKIRLGLDGSDAWLVGLLSFAGGNLPLIVLVPLLLMALISEGQVVSIE